MIKTAVYTSREIANALGAQLYGKDEIITGITIDSRELSHENTCFFAINGENFDGAMFINEACKNGAKLIVTDKEIHSPVSVIYVHNAKKALGMLGKYHKGSTKIIGVTGSVGKTTTKEMIKDVLSDKYSVCATYSNHNNEIGVALTLLSIANEKFCVVEMGMRQKGEIDFLSYLCQPEISVITNCGSAHIERLGSRENIFKAKTEILKHTKKFAVIPYNKSFLEIDYGEITPYFIGENGNFEKKNLIYTETGIKFDVMEKGISETYKSNIETKDIEIKSYGVHNADNAINAYAVGRICGMESNAIKKAFLKYQGEKMREKIFKIQNFYVIEDCYNASYEGMKSAILSLCEYAKANNYNPYAVLGDMLETGTYSAEYHYRIGEFAKDIGIKNIFSLGKYATNVIDGFCGGILCDSIRDAAYKIMNSLSKDDVILVKASHALHFEKIIDFMKEI